MVWDTSICKTLKHQWNKFKKDQSVRNMLCPCTKKFNSVNGFILFKYVLRIKVILTIVCVCIYRCSDSENYVEIQR